MANRIGGRKTFSWHVPFSSIRLWTTRPALVVDVEVSTVEASEGEQLIDQIKRVEANTGRKVKAVTADAAYAHSLNTLFFTIASRDSSDIIM